MDKMHDFSDINEKFKVLTETSPDCIKLFDVNGKLLYINPGGLREHNLKNLDEAINKDWLAIETIVEEDRDGFSKALREAINGKVSTIEIRHTKEGSVREVCLETIAPVKDGSGKIIGIFGVSRDISELKKIENELNEVKEGLEEKVNERTKELNIKLEELEKTNKIIIGRELRMIELKNKISDLINMFQ